MGHMHMVVPVLCGILIVAEIGMYVLVVSSYGRWGDDAFLVITGISAVVGLWIVVTGAVQRSARLIAWGALVLTVNVLPVIALVIFGELFMRGW